MNKDDGQPGQTRYQQDLQKLKEQGGQADDSRNYIEEEGKHYRLPYRTIRMVEFSNIEEKELIDPGHSARLQYRLLLLDAVIKAYVEFPRQKITVIYNPKEADNIREKTSQEELIAFLAKEGVGVDRSSITERDYDYYKEFYSYAFNPKVIREHPPYGYTTEQWRKMKPQWEKKMEEHKRTKSEKFREYQNSYEKLHPEVYGESIDGPGPQGAPGGKALIFKRIRALFN